MPFDFELGGREEAKINLGVRLELPVAHFGLLVLKQPYSKFRLSVHNPVIGEPEIKVQ
jgi:hypothetical protein